MTARLVVSVHDVAPASASATDGWLAELDRRGIPASLLVIPGCWRGDSLADRPGYQAFLRGRREQGDEIVQHGWQHRAGADAAGWRAVASVPLARGAAEFAALSEPAALLRLRAGRAVLANAGLPTAAFTAPGWLHSPGTLRALAACGFTHTTTHAGLVDLGGGPGVRGFAFAHRPGGAGERPAARLLRLGVRSAAASGGLVRIALHPDDLTRPGLQAATLAAIDDALRLGARPVTYRELLARPPA